MTATLISLISIVIGIIAANTIGLILKKYSMGIIGNTIAGVFGSILIIKLFGRIGIDPKSIIQLGHVNLNLFVLNAIVSFCGGAIAVILISKLNNKMNNPD